MNRVAHIVLLMIWLSLTGCVGRSEVGRLGHLLGKVITIEGIRSEKAKGGKTLLVEKIDGKSLADPIPIDIENIRNLSSSEKIILKGYERQETVGGEHFQWPEHLHSWFVVTHVITPDALKTEHSRFENPP